MRVTLNLSEEAVNLLNQAYQPGGRSRAVSKMIISECGGGERARLVKKNGRTVGVGVRPTSNAEVRKFINEWP